MRYSAAEFFLLVVGAVTTFAVAANAAGYALLFALVLTDEKLKNRRARRSAGGK